MAGQTDSAVEATGAAPSTAALPDAFAKPAPVVPPRGDIGVSGTSNQRGNILSESNLSLIYDAAYGRPGVRDWGEWELIRRTDESVSKALEFVLAPIRDASVSLQEPVDESAPEDKRESDELMQSQMRFIRWNIDAMEPGWPEFLNQTGGGALMNGFALHELVWDVCEHPDLPGGRGYYIKRLAERLPSSVMQNGWRENPSGELEFIRQQGPKGDKWVTVDLPVEKVLLNTWNRNGDNYLGFSAFRPVYYLAKIRRELARIIGIQHQRESCGIPIACSTGDNSPELTPEERASLEKFLAVAVYHENSNAIMPKGWKIDWVFAASTNKPTVINAFNELGKMILGQVGAQQLALGVDGTGSRSVGEVHAGSSNNYVQGVVGNIEAVVNGVGSRRYTGLVKKLVDANWGTQKRYPKLKITLKREQLSAPARINAMKAAVDGKLITVTENDENEVREVLGLSPIDAAQRSAELERRAALAPQPGITSKSDEPNGDDDASATPPAAKRPPTGAKMRRSVLSVYAPRRPLRASERRMDLTAMTKYLDRGREAFEEGVRPLVAELLVRAMPEVKRRMADGDPSDVGEVSLDMTKVDAFVREYLSSTRGEGYQQVYGEMRRGTGQDVARARADGVATMATKKPEPGKAREDADSVLNAARKHLTKRMQNRIASDLELAAVDVDRTDGDPSDIVGRVLGRQMDTGAFRNDAGLVLTKAFNVGRDEFAQEYGDRVDSVELSAIMDNNVCVECEELDGSEYDFNSPGHDEHTPPLSSICLGGDSCRCVLIYNFKDSDQ